MDQIVNLAMFTMDRTVTQSPGLAARPPTRSDVVRHAKCKHAVGVMTAAYDYKSINFRAVD